MRDHKGLDVWNRAMGLMVRPVRALRRKMSNQAQTLFRGPRFTAP
jgi:hypothetical protein